jgi:hypothetical protein
MVYLQQASSIGSGQTIKVETASGQVVPSQLVIDSTRNHEQFIYFLPFVDPLGAAQLFISVLPRSSSSSHMHNNDNKKGNDDFANEYIRLVFDAVTSLPVQWIDVQTGVSWPFTTRFLDYTEKAQAPGTNVIITLLLCSSPSPFTSMMIQYS